MVAVICRGERAGRRTVHRSSHLRDSRIVKRRFRLPRFSTHDFVPEGTTYAVAFLSGIRRAIHMGYTDIAEKRGRLE